jgi:hypothetical protein
MQYGGDHSDSNLPISCDMVQPCDTTQARLNLDFGVKVSTVQFYDIEHNSKSNSWIKLKLYHNISEIVFYVEVHFKVNQSSERTCDIGENRLYIYFLLTRELLIWQGSFLKKDMTACFENFLVPQESLIS